MPDLVDLFEKILEVENYAVFGRLELADGYFIELTGPIYIDELVQTNEVMNPEFVTLELTGKIESKHLVHGLHPSGSMKLQTKSMKLRRR